MTDNATLITIAAITGVPLLINAVSTGMLRRSQTKLAFLAVATKDAIAVQTQATVAVKDAIVDQSQATVSTKAEVVKVHALVNSQMTQLRVDLDAANERIAHLISKLPRRINGVKKPQGGRHA